MVEAKALQVVVPKLMPAAGWGLVICGDGDVSPTAINTYLEMAKEGHGVDQCAHLITIDGGPAAASPDCPFHKLTYRGETKVTGADYILARVEGMLKIKNKTERRIHNLGYEPHCFCGLCEETDVPVWHNFLWTIECKALMRREFPEVFKHHRIYPFIDYMGYAMFDQFPDGIAHYMVDRGKYERLAQRRNWG